MLVHRTVTPSIKFADTHLYTWVERGIVRVKCLAHEHNAMSPARSRTQTAQPGDERTNHEATAPHTHVTITQHVFLLLNQPPTNILEKRGYIDNKVPNQSTKLPCQRLKVFHSIWISKSQKQLVP